MVKDLYAIVEDWYNATNALEQWKMSNSLLNENEYWNQYYSKTAKIQVNLDKIYDKMKEIKNG